MGFTVLNMGGGGEIWVLIFLFFLCWHACFLSGSIWTLFVFSLARCHQYKKAFQHGEGEGELLGLCSGDVIITGHL